jgi:hypothetical protein
VKKAELFLKKNEKNKTTPFFRTETYAKAGKGMLQ